MGNLTALLSVTAGLAELTNTGAQIEARATLARAYTSIRARETVSWCRELFDGNGINLDYMISRFFGDAEAIHTYPGTL
jgi:glutaryl-CoA dehydrogenase